MTETQAEPDRVDRACPPLSQSRFVMQTHPRFSYHAANIPVAHPKAMAGVPLWEAA